MSNKITVNPRSLFSQATLKKFIKINPP